MRKAQFTKSISIAITPDLYAKVKQITDSRGESMASWLRRAAERALPKSMSQTTDCQASNADTSPGQVNAQDGVLRFE